MILLSQKLKRTLTCFYSLLLFFLTPTFCFCLYLLNGKSRKLHKYFQLLLTIVKIFIMAKNTIFIISTICCKRVAVSYFLKALCSLLKILLLRSNCNLQEQYHGIFLCYLSLVHFHDFFNGEVSNDAKNDATQNFSSTFGNYFIRKFKVTS